MFDNPEDVKGMMANNWQHDAFNAVPFQYDPVHDANATETLEAKPGERVRIYLVNAGPNEFSGFHPIAGIWDKAYPSGNPKNALTAMQNYTVAPVTRRHSTSSRRLKAPTRQSFDECRTVRRYCRPDVQQKGRPLHGARR